MKGSEGHRARLFHPDEEGKYFYGETTMAKSLHDLEPASDGDIAYMDDTYSLFSLGTWISLQANDPRIQGLYSQAVKAERAALSN